MCVIALNKISFATLKVCEHTPTSPFKKYLNTRPRSCEYLPQAQTLTIGNKRFQEVPNGRKKETGKVKEQDENGGGVRPRV